MCCYGRLGYHGSGWGAGGWMKSDPESSLDIKRVSLRLQIEMDYGNWWWWDLKVHSEDQTALFEGWEDSGGDNTRDACVSVLCGIPGGDLPYQQHWLVVISKSDLQRVTSDWITFNPITALYNSPLPHAPSVCVWLPISSLCGFITNWYNKCIHPTATRNSYNDDRGNGMKLRGGQGIVIFLWVIVHTVILGV